MNDDIWFNYRHAEPGEEAAEVTGPGFSFHGWVSNKAKRDPWDGKPVELTLKCATMEEALAMARKALS